MFSTTLSRPRVDPSGLAALAERWRAFGVAANASFFQDWTWVGCLAAERFPDPVLLEVWRGTDLVAMALFNRRVSWFRGDALYLHESNDPVLDSIFTEHNGPLLTLPHGPEQAALLARLFHDAMHAPICGRAERARRLVLSGVGPACAEAAQQAGGVVGPVQTRLAPYVAFSALLPGQPFLEGLSRNTRHQLRRSNRHYAQSGELSVHRASTVPEALEYLDALIALHEATWRARGKRGAFATPAVKRFHRALIARGVPSGEVDLLRIAAGSTAVGYLLNFSHGGQVSAYQSGFNYAGAGAHQKPGLTCHYLAIEAYRAAEVSTYDFLAGPDRYKQSLANAERPLHWLSVAPRWHPYSIAGLLRPSTPR